MVTVSLNKQCSTFEWEHVSMSRKILLTVLWATSTLQFSLPRHWHNVFLLNPLSRIQRNDSLQILNLVRSKEDMVKLYTRMTQSSPLSWCLCVVEYCHAVGGHYRLASTLSLQSTILVFLISNPLLYIYIRYIWFGLFGFYGISAIVGYLMPNPLYT